MLETPGVLIMDPAATEWRSGSRQGLWMKPAYESAHDSRFFGFIRFEAGTGTGLHQHKGPAFSYVLEGALHDYQGEVTVGQMGINVSPATHEAHAYLPTLFVARLEAAVTYPVDRSRENAPLHTGAAPGFIRNTAPDRLPDLNITVADLAMSPTREAGVGRRYIFDYGNTGLHRRCVQLQIMPECRLQAFRTADRLDLFVLGGRMSVNGRTAGPGFCVAIGPEQDVEIDSEFGALFFAWSEAPVTGRDDRLGDPFGFDG